MNATRKMLSRMNVLDEKRMSDLVRVYHNAAAAAEATGMTVVAIRRAAAKFGLSFRRKSEVIRNTYTAVPRNYSNTKKRAKK